MFFIADIEKLLAASIRCNEPARPTFRQNTVGICPFAYGHFQHASKLWCSCLAVADTMKGGLAGRDLAFARGS
jgi:hypothetical protein